MSPFIKTKSKTLQIKSQTQWIEMSLNSFPCLFLLLSPSLWSSPLADVRNVVIMNHSGAVVDGRRGWAVVFSTCGGKPPHPMSLPPNDALFLLIFLPVQYTHIHMRTSSQTQTHTTSAQKVQTARKFLLLRPLLRVCVCVTEKRGNNESFPLLKWCLTN